MLYRLLFISKAIGIASFWLFAVIVSKPYFMHKGRTFQAACGSFLCFSSALLLSVSVLEFKYNKALEAVGTKNKSRAQ